MLKNVLLAGLGGSIGTMMRYGMFVIFKTPSFPYATLLVNIVGSFIIGLLLAVGMRNPAFENSWKIFLSTGICGGFTTFSAFSVENLQMLQQGKYSLLAIYIISSITAGIFAAWVGYKIAAN